MLNEPFPPRKQAVQCLAYASQGDESPLAVAAMPITYIAPQTKQPEAIFWPSAKKKGLEKGLKIG